MTEEKKKKKFLKVLLIVVSTVILLVLIAFWLITSSWFITGIILPAVSDSIDMRITAEKVDFSLFKSRLQVKKLRIGSGEKALADADSLDVSFSLSDLMNERIVFHDVLLDNAVITMAKNTDGKWTYESRGEDVKKEKADIQKEKKESPQKKAVSSEKEPQKVFLNLKNIQITNSSFIIETGDEKNPAVMEFKDLNINLPELSNNKPAELTLKSNVSVKTNTGITVEKGIWDLSLKTSLDEYLHPSKVDLKSKLDNLDGIINGVKINDSNLVLDLEADGDKKGIKVKHLYLRQFEGKWVKTNVELNSDIDFTPFKMKGKFKIAPLSSEIITIISQFTRDINPGKVGVNWYSDFEFSEDSFSADGKMSLTRKNAAVIAGKKYDLPDLQVDSKYNFAFDSKNKTLKVKQLTAELNERGKEVLSLNANRPFTYLINEQKILEQEKAQIILRLTDLDLSLIKLFKLPQDNFVLNSGRLDGIIAFGMGSNQKILLGGDIKASELDFNVDSQHFTKMGFEQKISAYATKDLLVSIPQLSFVVNHNKVEILNVKGHANVDIDKDKAEFTAQLVDFKSNNLANMPLPADTVKQMDSFLSKIDPVVLNAQISGTADKGIMKLTPLNCEVTQNNKKIIGISFAPKEGNPENFAKESQATVNVYNIPIQQFNKLANNDSLKSGYLNGKIVAQIQDAGKNIKIDSSLDIDKISLQRMEKLIKELKFNLGFTASLKDYQKISLRDFVCGLRQNNSVIMGMYGHGDIDSKLGKGKVDMTLKYLNHHALNVFLPGDFKSGNLTGNFKLLFDDKFKNIEIDSGLIAKNISGGALKEAINGESTFSIASKPDLFICRKFLLDVSGAEGRIALINGSTNVPPAPEPVVIKLNSEIIDIKKVKQLFAVNEAPQTPQATAPKAPPKPQETEVYKAPEPIVFDIGKRPYLLLINLQGIKYNSILSAHVDGEIAAQGRSISVKNLDITSNKQVLNVKGNFLSTDKGVKFHTQLKSDEFNLTPIFKTFLPPDLKATRCTLKKLDLDIKGIGLQPNPLWDNMQGGIKSDLKDIEIPNNFNETMIGKIILLPFEIMVEIQKMVPDKTVQAMGKVASFVKEFKNDIRTIVFTHGQMNIASQDGLIYIRDFQLTGPTVKNLSFVGNLGLGSKKVLDVNSSLNISGIVLPVEMDGTVQKPEINYRKTTVKFMTTNAFNILDTTGKILKEGGGDLKKTIENIFDF